MIKVSIIIVNFNSSEFLDKCLASIKKSLLLSGKYEVIIVENFYSLRESRKLSKIIKKYSVDKFIKNKHNFGFAKANNIGIKSARGEYILLLNPDTLIYENTLNIMVKLMDRNKDIAVSTCRVELPDGQIDDACHRGFPTPLNSLFYFTGLGRLFPNSLFVNGYHLGYRNLDKIHEIDSCVGAFMMIRRNIGDELGWLDDDYFWYGEDLDFCYRVKENGYKVIYNPYTKIVHFKGISSGIKNHSSNLSKADNQTKMIATNSRFDVMKIFYQKHYLNKYPKFISAIVLMGIEMKRRLSNYENRH